MILQAILSKVALPALLFAGGIISGMVVDKMYLTKPVPDCVCGSCPEPTVQIQPFEVDKIKGLKEFNYSPQYTGNISVNGVDSAAVHKWIEQSVVKAIEKHVVSKDKNRRR